MSFLKKLFGLGGREASAPEAPTSGPTVEHNGFTIRATPYKEQGQFQLCGLIEKEIDGALKTHRFVRADRSAALDDAIEQTFSKGRLIVDQMGDRVFKE